MKVYLISGKARHGKDTTGNMLKEILEQENKKVCMTQYAKYLKSFCKDYFGWDGKEETKPREFLQYLGTDIIRKKLNKPYFHINRLLEDISILECFFDVMIVTDVRMPEEIDMVKNSYSDVVSINVVRPNFDNGLTIEQQNHITEIALDNYEKFDYILTNTTLDKLKEDVLEIARKEDVTDEEVK